VGITLPPLSAAKKEKPPIIRGLNEMKSGQCDGYQHRPIIINREFPPSLGGIIQLE